MMIVLLGGHNWKKLLFYPIPITQSVWEMGKDIWGSLTPSHICILSLFVELISHNKVFLHNENKQFLAS